jgi:DNA polymerase-3 subunit gamma/tau
VLELLCARMQLPDAAADSAALLQRIERLERRAGAVSGQPIAAMPAPGPAGANQPAPVPAAKTTPEPAAKPAAKASAQPSAQQPAEPTPAPEPPATPKPAAVPANAEPAPAPVADGSIDAAALRRLWPEVLDVVKAASRRTRALLDNAQIAGVDGELMTLSVESAPLAKMIADDSNTSLLANALTQVVGGNWKIAVSTDAAPAAAPAAPAPTARPATPPPSSAEPDPRDDTDDIEQRKPPGDPEAEAMQLLRDHLGARPVE